jgi:hypothetical protein
VLFIAQLRVNNGIKTWLASNAGKEFILKEILGDIKAAADLRQQLKQTDDDIIRFAGFS